ncbi:HAMP domain-containing sensor histidine kinase [Sphingosinicella sp. LHD-64]|uniref:sensor histidine kinase n=1 Tax=Sphingosinicella sp. LHD-64 TaxID=3072139 RepID=UPI00281064CA|nr:HAMP domain-containing sensor histidine kinase [Sphingosinicella sp. LHD-64]MDQ8757950.1 HAMP domain-containing sensor histidine kinase [Sphingosinicella sp. LHD-64]
MSILTDERPVTGRIDADGRLVAADPPLAALNERAGGREGGPLSVPQIAALARLARRLGITVSRAAIAADGDQDIDLWVRAAPEGDEVALSITGWAARPAAESTAPPEREADFVRAAADWTWETDDTLRLTALSAAAAAAIGRPAGELTGRQLTRLFRFRESADGSLPILAALAEHGRFDGQVAELRAGRKGRYRLSGVPLIDGMGRFAGFRGAAVSLRAEDAAPAPAATAVPHEGSAFGERLDQALRAPLTEIVDNAERLRARDEGPLRSDYAGYASDIATAGRHLLALVNDLVDLQAIERADFVPEAEEIDLADLARRAAGLLAVRAADQNVRIGAPAEDEALKATGDFTRTLQILVNLISNAVRYTPEGGQVWIRVEEEGDLALVIVADQGKGIAPDDQERIFGKFERVDPSEPGGTGLGLYIARRLARAMGGDLGVDSAPGQGARFTLTLPRA